MERQSADIRDILAFQAGDEQAFQRLFARYQKPICNYLFRFLGNFSIAEELTQEVFVRVCRSAQTYSPQAAFRNWIYRIATNVAKNEVRKREYSTRKASLEFSSSHGDGRTEEKYSDPGAETPEYIIVAKHLEREIQDILNRLPGKQKTALLLCRHHGFSYREIAEIMDLRQGAVKSLIHRATETLRRDLKPYIDPDPCKTEI